MALEDIQAIILDVDGVLTDGRLYYSAEGETLKAFYVQDGRAVKAWQQAGGQVAFLTGRDSPMVERRAAELGVEAVVQGVDDKRAAFYQLVKAWSLSPEQVCYVGDDTPDIEPMKACGFPVAVANAVPEVKRHARHVTTAAGGQGAVREVIDYLLDHKCTQ